MAIYGRGWIRSTALSTATNLNTTTKWEQLSKTVHSLHIDIKLN